MNQRVVFVCLGNICRSPTAEGVLRALAQRRGVEASVEIDSAGTSGYHVGEAADARMRTHASQRGYQLTSRSRQFVRRDFEEFDLIVAMDQQNKRDILALDDSGQYHDKVRLFCEFVEDTPHQDVPDPYYGGPRGFETVLDLVEAGSERILDFLFEKQD